MKWFEEEYKENLGLRYNTMLKALEIYKENKGEVILETGTTRLANDWGAGYSTIVFGHFLRHNLGKLITVDIAQENIDKCRDLTILFAKNIEYVVSDSLEYLENYKGNIDLLYLDSYDYPMGELLTIYNGQENVEEAMKALYSMTEEEIVSKHLSVINDSQEHQLKEFKLAEKFLEKGTPILLDDSRLPGGGKTRLTKKYLKEIGATCVLDEYQSLWVL